jgi:hypothetical protein
VKVSKEVTHTINLGPYESIRVRAGAEVDTLADFDEIPTDEEVFELLDELVDAVGGKTIDDAIDLAPEDSYAHHIRTTTTLRGKRD